MVGLEDCQVKWKRPVMAYWEVACHEKKTQAVQIKSERLPIIFFPKFEKEWIDWMNGKRNRYKDTKEKERKKK